MTALKRIQIFAVGLAVLLLVGSVIWFAFRPQADVGETQAALKPLDIYLSSSSPYWVQYFNYLVDLSQFGPPKPLPTPFAPVNDHYSNINIPSDIQQQQALLTEIKALQARMAAILRQVPPIRKNEVEQDMRGLSMTITALVDNLKQNVESAEPAAPTRRLNMDLSTIRKGMEGKTPIYLFQVKVTNLTTQKSQSFNQDGTIDFARAHRYEFTLFFRIQEGFCRQITFEESGDALNQFSWIVLNIQRIINPQTFLLNQQLQPAPAELCQ